MDVLVLKFKYDLYISLFIWNKVELEGYSWLLCYDVIDDFELKYVGLYCESYFLMNIDFDNMLLDIFDVLVEYDDINDIYEIQVNLVGDNYIFVSGVYFYDGELCGNFDVVFGFFGCVVFGILGLICEVLGCNNSESWVVYGQLNYDIINELLVLVGVCYIDEEKQVIVFNGLIFDNVYFYFGWILGYVCLDG